MKRTLAGGAAPDPSRDSKRDPPRDPPRDPWRAPIIVAQIPESGLTCEIQADHAQREAMATIAGLREISVARAQFTVAPDHGGMVHVTGHLRARIGQTCVVTLEDIENDIDEEVDVMFAPEGEIKEVAEQTDEAAEDGAEMPEPPEPIRGGVIDLGRLATDVLFLAIDPYPRKPGAVFEPRVEAADPADHPFAALRGLRPSDTDKNASKKPDHE